MSNETKPVTAEEILNKILSAAYQVLGGDISKNDFFKSGGPKLRDWVDHQIAVLREEAEFRANTADFFMEDRQRYRESCKELALENKELAAELEALKVKHQHTVDLLKPIIDWAQSDSSLQIGDSICKEVVKRAKECASLKEGLAIQQAKADSHMAEALRYRKSCTALNIYNKAIALELEILKKELGQLKKSAKGQLRVVKVATQGRDEAVKALEAVQRIKPLVQYPDTIGVELTDDARAVAAAMEKVDVTLSRLSAGETKAPESPNTKSE